MATRGPQYDDSHVEHQDVDHIEHIAVSDSATRNAGVYRLQEAIYFLFGIIEVLIALRFGLRAFGANPAAPFSAAIYTITGPLVAPFNGMFGEPQLSQSVFEPQSIVAILVYALVGWALAKIVWLLMADAGGRATTEKRVVHSERHDEDLAA
jgi:hypothetical protein